MLWKVTYITYEEYEVEAETEDEAIKKAEKEFDRDRSKPIVSTWYDEREVECLEGPQGLRSPSNSGCPRQTGADSFHPSSK